MPWLSMNRGIAHPVLRESRKNDKLKSYCFHRPEETAMEYTMVLTIYKQKMAEVFTVFAIFCNDLNIGNPPCDHITVVGVAETCATSDHPTCQGCGFPAEPPGGGGARAVGAGPRTEVLGKTQCAEAMLR